ncbi:MAG: rod shape-determining protein MreD, partial [Sphingobacteriaceae bacterium]|nr:rod shape-determining protein MreD [Sphingobacteriaceae bacterium]
SFFFRWIVLISIQILFLRNLNLYDLQSPFLYVLFIILLPISIPNLALYSLAFLTGLTLDVFYDTLGVHAAACVFTALIRTLFLSISISKENFNDLSPSFHNMGFVKFSTFVFLCVLSHHLVFFFLEAYKVSEFFYTLFKSFTNCIFTTCLILVLETTFYAKKNH